MDLLLPANLVFAALGAPIILMYFLKLRRQRLAVSSTLLWLRTLEDLRVNAPFKRMKRSLLLLLQLLVLLLLVFSATRLMVEGAQLDGDRVIILLDRSASMQTRDAEGQRFQLARADIEALIEGKRDAQHVAVIAFDRQAHMIVPFTNERQRLLAAVRELAPVDMGTDPTEAFDLAETLAEQVGRDRAGASVTVHLFSDGGFHELRERALAERDVTYHRYGPADRDGDNFAIVGVSARRLAQNDRRFVIACQVLNAGAKQRETFVELRIDGRLIETKRAVVPPSSDVERSVPVLFNDERITPGIAHVKLVGDDDLSVDNEGWLVLTEPEWHSVAVVTATPPSANDLWAIFKTTRQIDASFVRPDDAETYLHEMRPELAVLDHWTVDEIDRLPDGNYVFIGAAPPYEGFNFGDPLEYPQYIPEHNPHRLLRDVRLQDFWLVSAPQVQTPPWIRVIATARETGVDAARETVMLGIGERDNRRFLVMGFDPAATSPLWFHDVSWVQFWKRVMEWFFASSMSANVFGRSTNQPLSVALPVQASRATLLRRAGGVSREVEVTGGDDVFHFGLPGSAGVYDVTAQGTAGGGDVAMTVGLSLLDAEESLNVARASLPLGTGAQVVEGRERSDRHMRELWQTLLVIALVVLMLEWFVFHRRPFG